MGALAAAVTLSWVGAGPAAARGAASLGLAPNHGGPSATFAAVFRVTSTATCPGGQVDFTFDGQPLTSAGLDPVGCTASAAMQVPMGATPGPHKVKGTLTGGTASVSASQTFTVDQTVPPTTPPGQTTSQTQPGQPTSSSSSATPDVTFSNTITPTTPWNPPPFVPQQLSTGPVACDTSGPHAASPKDDVLVVPAYAAGAHAAPQGSPLVHEPLSGRLPIASVGPAAMLPPRLGVDAYQSLEVLEPIDPAVSPKLRLAAAAGEPFSCLQVEAFGPPGSGYGYLVFALKGALVISAQDANADGTPFVAPAPAPSPTPVPKGAKQPTPAPVPKPVFERLVLGYTSISWEWQELGGDKAPLHRGAGTIQPPPPSAPLSYGNLAVAFGGLVAATVALMFAYHSRRRELLRRRRVAGGHL